MTEFAAQALTLLALVACCGFLASAETAILAAREGPLQALARKGYRRAKLIQRYQSEPFTFLPTLRVGKLVCALLAGLWAGEEVLVKLDSYFSNLPWAYGPGVAAVLALLTVIALFVALFVLAGEILPKALVVTHPERWALMLVRPTQAVILIASPVMRPLMALGGYVTKKSVESPTDPGVLPEDDVQWLVKEGTRRGVFNATEQELISQVFKFANLPVKRAMTPRTDISAIDKSWSQNRVLQFIATEGYSRYPVHAGHLDRIVGVIHTKDVITVLTSGGVIIIDDLIRPPMFVPSTQTLGPVLRRMQKQQEHLALVLDEYGGTAGLVTLEDLLEEIVGEIRDEHDRDEPVLALDESGRARIPGSLSVGHFNEAFPAALDEKVADTMAGLFVLRLGRIPKVGDALIDGGIRFTAECVKENRLEWLTGERVLLASAGGPARG